MGIFDKQIAFVDSLDEIIAAAIREAFDQFGFVIVEFIVDRQLYELGEDGNKVRLQGYSRATIRLKIAKKQPADRTTLRDKGRFHASINIDAREDGLLITSNVPYDEKLVKRYGKAILQPSTDNIEIFVANYVIPTVQAKIAGYLKG